jgi:hypothetical protein
MTCCCLVLACPPKAERDSSSGYKIC